MELKIYDKANNLRLTASPNSSSTVTEEIGGECSVSASFTHTAYVPLDVDDYIELEGVRYKVKSRYRPKQKNTQTYEYSVKFYAPIHDAEDTLILFQEGETTSEFSYDGGPREHLQLWIDNMNRRAGGNLWSIGTVITAENKTIDYRNVKCWDAAFGSNGIAATFETEMWADGYVINLCKAERGEVVELGYLQGLTNLAQEDNGEVKFFTRLFPLGSTRNIDATKYGYSRLQLPDRSLYVDKNVDLYGVKEDTEENAFSDIYPKYVGTVSSVRTEEKTSEEGREYTVFYFKDNGMNWNPKNYEIPDLDYMLQFQTGELVGRGTDGSFQAAWHEDTGEWEIINVYPDDTTQIPGGAIIPQPGDQYIPWNFAMPQEYITEAEQEYKLAVDNFLDTYSFDPNKYTGTTDRNYIERNNTPLRIGWNVRLLSEQYFGGIGGYKDTRITKVQRKLNDLCQATITCSDQVGTGWKSSVDNQLNNLKYVLSRQEEQTIIDIIRTTDSKTPSDNNVFSALNSLYTFLCKNKPDSTNYLIRFLGGLISDNIESQDFASGPLGTGFIVKRDPKTGRSYIEADEIYIRLKAYFDTLEIKHLSHVGGRIVLSPASMECIKVEKISGETDALYDINGDRLYDSLNSELYAEVEGQANVYRCYFNTTDGEKTIYNEFAVDDLAQCREFNVKSNVSQQVANQYYWRRVVGVGDDYIDLSISDCDVGSLEPKAGDTIVTIGNKTDTNRQHVIFLSSYDDDAPCFKLYSGINSYSMLNKEVTVISPNADKNVFTGKVVIKPGSTGFGNFEDGIDIEKVNKALSDAVKAAQDAQESANNAEGAVKDLNDYVDGAFADGIIEQSEAQAIEKYINQVNATKDEVTATYEALYVNQFLTGTAKTNLLNVKVTFMGAIDNLIAAINAAILDGKTTQTEKENVDTKYSEFISAYSDMSRAIELANQAIQDKIKEAAAEEALTKVESQIQEVSDKAKDDLARQMGYINGYADMVKASEKGDTVIAGGRINTKLIEADAIVTTALIASAIMTKTLNVNNNFVVDTQGNVNLEGNAVIGGNGIFRGAIETTFVNVSESDAIYEGTTGTYPIYRLNKKLNVIAGICKIKLPIDMSYASKRVTIVNDVTIYTRTEQSTHIIVDSGMGLYGIPIPDSDRDGDVYVSELSILTGLIELVAIPVVGKSYVRWFVTNISAAYYNTALNKGSSPEPTEYTITTLSNPYSAGTIIGGGKQIKGYVGQLTAIPNTGYVFRNWSTGETDNPLTVTWDSSKTITANFEKGLTNPVELILSASPSDAGSVTGAGLYEKGYRVPISAQPNAGWAFSRWSDGDINMNRYVVLDTDKSLTAYFTEHQSTDDNLIDIYLTKEVIYGNITFNTLGTAIIVSVTESNGEGVLMINRGLLSGKIKSGVNYRLSFNAFYNNEQSETTIVTQTFVGAITDTEGNNIDAMVFQNEQFVVSTDNSKGITLTFTANRNSTSQDGICITFIDIQKNNPVFISNLELKEV